MKRRTVRAATARQLVRRDVEGDMSPFAPGLQRKRKDGAVRHVPPVDTAYLQAMGGRLLRSPLSRAHAHAGSDGSSRS